MKKVVMIVIAGMVSSIWRITKDLISIKLFSETYQNANANKVKANANASANNVRNSSNQVYCQSIKIIKAKKL